MIYIFALFELEILTGLFPRQFDSIALFGKCLMRVLQFAKKK